jgi:hypothetical protein
MMPRMRVLEPGLVLGLLAHGNRYGISPLCCCDGVSWFIFGSCVSLFFCTWALAWFSYGIYPIEARFILHYGCFRFRCSMSLYIYGVAIRGVDYAQEDFQG